MTRARMGIAVATAFVLVAFAASAGDPPKTYDPRAAFAEADTNHDGAVDHEEFQERIVEVFYFADADKNGFLDAKELKQLPFAETIRDDDKDADGRVSLRELLRVRFRDFQKADTNDDGVLSVDEVVVIFQGRPR